MRAAGDSLQALRAGTRAQHEAIEQVMQAERLGEASHHRGVMQAFLDFHTAWEPLATQALLDEDDRAFLASGSRWRCLQDDASALALQARALPRAPERPWLPEQVWGGAYVLWGSMLGGRVICRQHPHAMLANGEPAPGWAYFHGWGHRTGALWAAFMERLQTRSQQAGWQHSLAVQAAQDTFACLTSALEGALDGAVMAHAGAPPAVLHADAGLADSA